MDIDEKKLLLAYGITQADSTCAAIMALRDEDSTFHREAYNTIDMLAELVERWIADGFTLTASDDSHDAVLEARAYLTEHVIELDALIAERMPHGIAP